MDLMSLLSLGKELGAADVGKGDIFKAVMSAANKPGEDGESFLQKTAKGMKAAMDQQQYSTLLDPAFYGQQNASGSNAPLDKALGKEARKIAGASEGGATPQLDNTVPRYLTDVNRTPTATQATAPKEEGLFTKFSNWWGSDSGKDFRNKMMSGITSYLNR